MQAGAVVTGYFGKGILLSIDDKKALVWANMSVESIYDFSLITDTGYKTSFTECMSAAKYNSKEEDIRARLKELPYLSAEITKYTYLAITHTLPDGRKQESSPEYMRTKDIIDFLNEYYKLEYKMQNRETIRKVAIKELLDKNLIEPTNLPKTSGRYGYKALIQKG